MVNNLYWREELPEGWRSLFERLVGDLVDVDPDVVIEQAKEKFGGLRVYLDRSAPALDQLVLDAECASARMCQTCGREEGLCHSTNHQYRVYATLCPEHRGDCVIAAEDPILLSLHVSPDGSVREVKRR